jgi:hypothetical protein
MPADEMSKKRFLVVYDYGQGGVWAYLLAESSEYLRRHFPQLAVHDQPPSWMSAADLEHVARTMTIDAENWEHPFLSALHPK